MRRRRVYSGSVRLPDLTGLEEEFNLVVLVSASVKREAEAERRANILASGFTREGV